MAGQDAKLQLYAHHPRSWRENRYVYPVVSRRAKGLSIGVNLNPDKVCNFDCIYCCVDRTVPATIRKVDMAILADELDHMLGLAGGGEIFRQPPFDQTPPALRRTNDIAFSGDGEPTSFSGFLDACRLAADLLAKHRLPDVKIVVITNATLFHRPAVVAALQFLDHHNGEIWAKLDAGTDEYYQRVERTSIPLSRVIDNIAMAGKKRPIVIQSLFMNVDGQPPPPAEITAYVEQLRGLAACNCQIKLVQIYTTARDTAEAFVTPLPQAALEVIAAQVRQIGLNVETFG